ncbi:MAG: hypothetical protein ACYTHN_22265 [Planctomycetota bacterium]|jgi:hypothetical protein
MDEGKKDAKEVKEILEVVSEKVPALIRGLMESVFSESAGREMGKAVAAFYKELKETDLPPEVVLEMTREYMRNFTNIGKIIQNVQESK